MARILVIALVLTLGAAVVQGANHQNSNGQCRITYCPPVRCTPCGYWNWWIYPRPCSSWGYWNWWMCARPCYRCAPCRSLCCPDNDTPDPDPDPDPDPGQP